MSRAGSVEGLALSAEMTIQPPLPLPAASISVELAPIFAPPKKRKTPRTGDRNACYAGYSYARV